MKNLILTLLAILCINASAQNNQDTVLTLTKDQFNRILKLLPAKDSILKEAKSMLPDSSQVSFSKVYSDVKGGIQGLAASLKVGAEHVYEVLVRQQLVYSITYTLLIIACIIAWHFFVKGYKYGIKNDWEEGIIFYAMFGGGGLTVLTILSALSIKDVVTGFINPEYGAIQDIINFVK